MSARLMRKVLEERELQKNQQRASAEYDEEEKDDSPSLDSAAPSRNPFDLLDDQEDEHQVDEVETLEDVVEKEVSLVKQSFNVIPSSDNKSKKKKRKKKNKEVPASRNRKDEKSIESILEDLSITQTTFDCQIATNDSKASNGKSHVKHKNERTSYVLTVDPKHLKAENELRKIFGSKVVNSVDNRQSAGTSRHMFDRRRAAYNPRKTMIITPSSHWPRWDGSLSMDLLETKGGIHYFRYTHSQSYMYVQEAFEASKATHDINAIASILAHHPYHIESLLTFAEVFKFSGEHQSSADAIGKCLFALECAWHPLFISMDGNSQLKYSHDTNKPFFSALFSHMKNMDRRGCHRSALEVCKLLLSLDSDDPMGALFCVDYFSLRAQEFAWLEQFSEEYKSDSSMWLFPNFSYSLAVCRFYLEQDSATTEGFVETEKATSSDLMKQALMLHPLVLKKLVDKTPLKDSAWAQILKSSFFGYAKSGSPSLEHLINIYVERNYLIWRFPELQNLLKQAALEIIESLKNDDAEAKDWACIRREAFSSEKNEYSHLMVVDFSDTVASIPPEELRQFMGGGQRVPNGMLDVDANPDTGRDVREVAGRNPAVVFLESLLPWVDYGANGNGQQRGDHQDIQD